MSIEKEILSFDEWYKEAKKLNINGFSANDFFEAGQQSKQAEIDELIDTIKTSAESEMYLFDELQKVKGERDDLQKRIDDIVKLVECNKAYIPLSEWHGYTTEEYVDADDLLDILKGENRE